MKTSNPKSSNTSAQAATTTSKRPLRLGGGPAGYVDNALKAVAEPFKGITAGGALVPGLFPIQKTGVPTDPIREAATEFLGSLSPEQRAKTLFPVDTVEWRKWSNIHRTLMRHGTPFFEMTDAQRDRAFVLLKETLGTQGFETARGIIRLNETVMEMTGRLDEYGEDLYWFSIMGTPSATEPWGWQIDGHHLNLNTFVLGDQMVMTPAFLGSEPVFAKSGKYAGTRVFKAEEEQGLAVIRAFSADQRNRAVLAPDLPREPFTTAFRDNFDLRYEGIPYDALSSPQRDLLLRLVEVHVGRIRAGHAEIKMEEVKQHLRQTHFAWMGGVEEDSVFYYRVQSPVIIIEFDHQRGQAFPQYEKPYRDHIHVVVRTPNGNDYGKDLLRQHYEQSHHHTNPLEEVRLAHAKPQRGPVF
ncbi:MAG TPA: DUF3500 domain-containing protein [Candidatus Binatia bacterium]|nr:DUF3500 domain-containing protein [Candidatus Binatia bacterium]